MSNPKIRAEMKNLSVLFLFLLFVLPSFGGDHEAEDHSESPALMAEQMEAEHTSFSNDDDLTPNPMGSVPIASDTGELSERERVEKDEKASRTKRRSLNRPFSNRSVHSKCFGSCSNSPPLKG